MILILKNNKADRTIRNKDKKLAEDLKNNKKKELTEPASLGRTTKLNSKNENLLNSNKYKKPMFSSGIKALKDIKKTNEKIVIKSKNTNEKSDKFLEELKKKNKSGNKQS